MPSGWRIADPDHSKTVSEMLSGEGAYLHGGRWNSKGYRVVYLGANLATAAMELLVHIGSTNILNQFKKIEVIFDNSFILLIDPNQLPKNWNNQTMTPTTQLIGNDWLDKKESLILKVPSVAVDGESNYLLNPNHSDFDKITVSSITLFKLDPRLAVKPKIVIE